MRTSMIHLRKRTAFSDALIILRGVSLLHAPDDIVEIRSIEPKPIVSGYFRANSPAIQSELSR